MHTENQGRIEWVDAMRGFSMIVVVLGHVLLSMGLGGYDSFLSYLFLTFRMPLFFFVSGFFSYRALAWWTGERIANIMKRKFQAQILCTFVFLFIYELVFRGGFIGLKEGFLGYWFTIVLFQMYVCYLVLSLISRYFKINITFAGLIFLSVAGIVILAFYRKESEIWNLLSWENLTKYFQFFALGIICSHYREFFFMILKNSFFKAACIIGWVVCLLLVYSESFRLGTPLAYSFVHDIIVRYCGLFTVIIMFFGNANSFAYSRHGKKLQFIGRRTLDIYMIHYFFLPDLKMLGPYLSGGNMFVIQLIISATITAIIVMLCLVVSSILRQSPFLAQWLFGVRKLQLR